MFTCAIELKSYDQYLFLGIDLLFKGWFKMLVKIKFKD